MIALTCAVIDEWKAREREMVGLFHSRRMNANWYHMPLKESPSILFKKNQSFVISMLKHRIAWLINQSNLD